MGVEQRNFIKNILFKKFVVSNDWEIKELTVKQKSENKWKFVIKRAMKFLFKRFKKNFLKGAKGEKLQDEKQFYSYYFQ